MQRQSLFCNGVSSTWQKRLASTSRLIQDAKIHKIRCVMTDGKKYIFEDYTSYIVGGIVKRRSNIFFEWLVRLLFRKTEFDAESLETLKEYEGKGRTVFASYQSTATSLLVFTNLLKKEGLSVPVLALGFRQYLLQKIFTGLRQIGARVLSALGIRSYRKVSDGAYIEQVISSGKSLALSIFSRTLFLRRYVDVKKDFVYELVALQEKTEEPIFVFPQIMFWNLNPERTGADVSPKATGDRGLISAFFTTRRSATPAFVRIAKPVNLQDELAQGGGDVEAVSAAVRRKLHDIFNSEKRVVLGPVIRNRHEMMERVLLHPNVLNEIQKQIESGAKERKLRQKAFDYFNEIAADFSINYLSFLNKVVNFIFKKVFNGISFDAEGFKHLREASLQAPVVIVSAHKSHMDYLIISSLCYRNKIMPPHIVAGANLRFFPMGKIFRRCGAFFMRRSFRGLNLYAVIFKQYIKTLVSEGYPIEFFIEGGRTRTGKLMFPKLGILKYLTDAVDEGYSKDLMLIPVTINYERVLEETSYSGELKGKEKKKESTISFVQSRSLLKRNYGHVHMSLNKPVSLAELRGRFANGNEVGYLIESQKRADETEDIAMFLARRINEIAMATPFSLVTTGILNSGAKGFTRSALLGRVELIYDYLKFADIPMTEACSDSLEQLVDYVLNSYKQDSIIGVVEMAGVKTLPSLNSENIYLINKDERMRIWFYKNNIVCYLLPASFFALALLDAQKAGSAAFKDVKASFDYLMQFFSKEFIYPDSMFAKEECLRGVAAYMEGKGWLHVSEDIISINEEKKSNLIFFAEFSEEYLEAAKIVLEQALKLSKEKPSRKDFLADVRKHGVKMYNEDKIKLVEALSVSGYNSTIDMLLYIGCLEQGKSKNDTLYLADRAQTQSLYGKAVKYLDLINGG